MWSEGEEREGVGERGEMRSVYAVEGEGGSWLLQPGDVVRNDLLSSRARLGWGLWMSTHTSPYSSPSPSSLLNIFLHFLDISFKFGSSVLEPRYHLIKKPDDYGVLR